MKFPVKLREIDEFDKLNTRISVNVFGHRERKIYPLKVSRFNRQKEINLLLIHDERHLHYCLIKNMSRLLRSIGVELRITRTQWFFVSDA